jgi:hypothetical protein
VSGQPKRNPFHELGLPVDASPADVVRQGRERVELAATEEEAQNARWAMQELNRHPHHRARYELLEMPDTDYGDDAWERFARRNRKNPVDLDALVGDTRRLRSADFDLHAVLGLLLDDLLTPPAPNVEPAVRKPPDTPTVGPPPLEVRDVIFG